MAESQPRERLFRMSLRELLLLFAVCALALVSLRFASAAWEGFVASIVALVLVVALIVALVDRQARQAFAIGLAVSLLTYGGLLVLSTQNARGVDEFNPEAGRLPTTRLLRPLYYAVAQSRWIDFRSGQEVPGHDPQNPGPDEKYISLDERPERGAFMRIGHCWWALVLGYLGGMFGRFVYLRRLGGPER